MMIINIIIIIINYLHKDQQDRCLVLNIRCVFTYQDLHKIKMIDIIVLCKYLFLDHDIYIYIF